MDIVYRFDPLPPHGVDSPRTSRSALRQLAEGNRKFSSAISKLQETAAGGCCDHQIVVPLNLATLGWPITAGQTPDHHPFAVVLSCSDARAPVEQIFNCDANDLFVVRVAGNVLGLECLASVDYACLKLKKSLRAAVVLGHTGCGAVTAAVDMYLAPNGFMDIAYTHAMRSLLDRIMLAVRSASRALDDVLGSSDHFAPGYRDLLLTASLYLNAALTAFDLQREIQSLGGREIAVVYSIYDLGNCRTSARPGDNGDDASSIFLPAPKDSKELGKLALQIAQEVVGARAPSSKKSGRRKR